MAKGAATMSSEFKVEIINPENPFSQEDINEVVLPA